MRVKGEDLVSAPYPLERVAEYRFWISGKVAVKLVRVSGDF